jgi:GH25 family lysozyme M1 (1,4-beta-N-acetylmuramidase)
MALGLLTLLASVAISYATLGVDVSQPTSVFSCLKSSGYQFAIVRGYQSNGQVDSNAVNTIKNARNAGFQYVDVYAFPCVSCGNAAGQASTLINALKGSSYGTIWLDVESYSWSSNLSTNQAFITSYVNSAKSQGKAVGIYSSYYNWQSIVGLSWSGVSNLPLWYAHYDNSPSFSDFTPFGGWSKPAMKQYAGDKTVCGAGVDLNYY